MSLWSAIGDAFGSIVNTATGGLFGLAGDLISNASASDRAEEQYEHNLALQKQSQEYNTSERLAAQQFTQDMWNKNNAYNAPSSQVARLKAAGLNPLSASMQSSNAQMVGSSPQASSGSLSVSQAPPVSFANTVQAALAAGQLEVMKANARKTENEGTNVAIDNQTKLLRDLMTVRQARAELEKANIQTAETASQIKVLKQQEQLLAAEYNRVVVGTHIDVKSSEQRDRELDIASSNAKTNRMNAITNQVNSETQRILANSNVKLNNAAIRQYNHNVSSILQDVKLKKITAGEAAVKFKILYNKFKRQYDISDDSGIGQELAWSFYDLLDRVSFGTGVTKTLK